MDELIQTIKEYTVERLKNPLIPGFIVGWLTFNWEVLAILVLSAEPIAERLDLVEGLNRTWLLTIVYPALIGVAYLIAMPWLAYAGTWVQSFANSRRKKFQIEQEIEVTSIRIKLVRLKAMLDIEAKKSQIETLNNDISRMSDRISDDNGQARALETAITCNQERLEQLRSDSQALIGQWKGLVLPNSPVKIDALRDSKRMNDFVKSITDLIESSQRDLDTNL